MSLLLSFFLCFIAFCKNPANAQISKCRDNFFDFRTCKWSFQTPTVGSWFLKDKELYGTSKYILTEHPITALSGEFSWANYSVETEVKNIKGIDKIILGRYQNANFFYELNLRAKFNEEEGNDLVLTKHLGTGGKKILSRIPFQNQTGNFYKLKLEFKDKTIKASINDQLIITYQDNHPWEQPIETGQAGLMVWPGNYDKNLNQPETTSVYRNFQVENVETKETIIFLPGFGASWNLSALINCDLDQNKNWTLAPYASLYRKLIETLKNGYKFNQNFFLYTYDWRLPLKLQGQLFHNYLNNLAENLPTGAKVHLIGHSLGGLVISSFLNQFQKPEYLDKIITLGSPHRGAAVVYQIWEEGQIPLDDPNLKLAINALVIHCQNKLETKNQISTIQLFSPSLKDLLPTYPFLLKNSDQPYSNEINTENSWLKNNPPPSGNNVYSISGNNQKTILSYEISEPTLDDKINGLYKNGQITKTNFSNNGDNTVLSESALIPNSQQFVVDNTNHNQLIYQDNGIKTLLSILNKNSLDVWQNSKTPLANIATKPLNPESFFPFVWTTL